MKKFYPCSHEYQELEDSVIGEPEVELISSVPFETDIGIKLTEDSFINPSCRNCAQHPSNGGSGFCHCILGNPEVTSCGVASNSHSITTTTWDEDYVKAEPIQWNSNEKCWQCWDSVKGEWVNNG